MELLLFSHSSDVPLCSQPVLAAADQHSERCNIRDLLCGRAEHARVALFRLSDAVPPTLIEMYLLNVSSP